MLKVATFGGKLRVLISYLSKMKKFNMFLFWKYLNSIATGFLSDILLPFPNSYGLNSRVPSKTEKGYR